MLTMSKTIFIFKNVCQILTSNPLHIVIYIINIHLKNCMKMMFNMRKCRLFFASYHAMKCYKYFCCPAHFFRIISSSSTINKSLWFKWELLRCLIKCLKLLQLLMAIFNEFKPRAFIIGWCNISLRCNKQKFQLTWSLICTHNIWICVIWSVLICLVRKIKYHD